MRSSGNFTKKCLVECQGIYVDVSHILDEMIETRYENYKDINTLEGKLLY